jgi:ABC-type multidrug transport system fused ATPase/permease subunit
MRKHLANRALLRPLHQAGTRIIVCSQQAAGLVCAMWRFCPNTQSCPRWREVWKIKAWWQWLKGFSIVQKGMVGLVLLNLTIAVLAALLPKILGDVVELLDKKGPFFETALALSATVVLIRFPHAVLFEALRNVFVVSHVRSALWLAIGRRCVGNFATRLKRLEELGERNFPPGGERPAILSSGRSNLIVLLEGLLREPLFALVSAGIIWYLARWFYVFAIIVVAEIICETVLTGLMDHNIKGISRWRQRFENRLIALEIAILNSDGARQAELEATYERWLKAFRRVWIKMQVRRTQYELARETMTTIFRILIMLMAAWHVDQGMMCVGEFVTVIGLAERAAIPMRVLYWLLAELMERRPSVILLETLLQTQLGVTETPEPRT